MSARCERLQELDRLIESGNGDRPGVGPIQPPLKTPHRAKLATYAAKMRAGNTPSTRTAQLLRGWPNARRIMARIAALHGLELSQLQKDGKYGGRFRVLVQARAEAMAQVRKELGYSWTVIGQIFGGYHCASVIHLVRKVEAQPVVVRLPVEVKLEALEHKAAELAQGIAELRGMMGEASLFAAREAVGVGEETAGVVSRSPGMKSVCST